MTHNQLVLVPVHYDMWMRGETAAYFQRSFVSRKSGPGKGRTIAVLKGVRSGRVFKVWQDELELAQV